MRVLIGGSRTIVHRAALEAAIQASSFEITEVVTGTSSGVDELAAQWAKQRQLPLTTVPVDWAKHGGRGQRVRDEQATLMAQACIMVWDGFSGGTNQMIELARTRGLEVVVYQCNPQSPASGGTTTIHRAIRSSGDPTPRTASATVG